MIRFFRATPAVYENVCGQLDNAYGYPNEATQTLRTLPRGKTLPTDAQGRVYLAVRAEFCGYTLPMELLPQLLASGDVEEISQSQYEVVVPPPPPAT